MINAGKHVWRGVFFLTRRQNDMSKLRHAILLVMLTAFSASSLMAETADLNAWNSEAISREFDYLSNFMNPDTPETFNPDKIPNILNFQLSPPAARNHFNLENRNSQTAAWHVVELEKGLDLILRYAFNPEIPSHIFSPASVRFSAWNESLRSGLNSTRLWEQLKNQEAPVVIRGQQQVGITPDVFTGAYYTYDEDKTIILFKHNGRNVLINLSKQKDISDVGRKGLVVGPDEDWNYFYSGLPGLTKPGLGWVKSYMYDSFSVSIFYETDSNRVTLGIYKWLRAGWAGANMVKSRHIQNGLIRYARTFEEIMESPKLPDPIQLAGISQTLGGLSDSELRRRIESHYKILYQEQLQAENKSLKEFSNLMDSDDYIDHLSRQEIVAILTVECMKSLLGKKDMDESGILIGQSQSVSIEKNRP